ncbi:DUF4129 domain-containing protein [Pontibacter cellulosilyticus]|uniref:DUF4129 domain-containing protein n=1 Tax=Pontibacter cellulosilyticus TaxID=1720253 RepID=A0A923N987_9BACT|nr:DUF4129 domain-containing protein [Pontibacter cellulosilyticus]MBC5994548.1 DUF4129 domain-containing protein [Pontibacter cellulosilyticus]
MRVSFRHLFLTILILCLPFGVGQVACAQTPDSIPEATSPINVRPFEQEKLKQLQASKEFEYFEEVKPDETFLERLWRKFKQWLRDVIFNGQSSTLWEYLIYAVLAGAILLVIIKIQGIDIGSLLGKKAVASEMPYEVYEENIHEMDINGLIEEAIQQRDFRKAIRLHYLQSLKNLTNHGFILWKPGKTNRSYINEIKATDLRHEFEQLTSMFEYVWYGGAALGDELFTSARAEFILFDKQLNQYA